MIDVCFLKQLAKNCSKSWTRPDMAPPGGLKVGPRLDLAQWTRCHCSTPSTVAVTDLTVYRIKPNCASKSRCLSVCLSVRLSVTNPFCLETTGRCMLVLAWSWLLFTYPTQCCEEILGISKWNFVPSSGFRKFRHNRSIVLSTKPVDCRACWPHLRRSPLWLDGRCYTGWLKIKYSTGECAISLQPMV